MQKTKATGSDSGLMDGGDLPDTSGEMHVIYSPNESAASGDGAGFWSYEDGWTTFGGATKFSAIEIGNFILPMSLGQDAKWVKEALAEASYAEYEAIPSAINDLPRNRQ